VFPPPATADEDGLVGIGADLEPGTLLGAYRRGLFPMPAGRGRVPAWWSPDPRGVIPLHGLRITRSLRRSCERYQIGVDTAFEAVLHACADPRRPGAWIDRRMRAAYLRLHELGWAHSIEAWTPDGELAGGLYGVAIGGLFAGESMFHRGRDASKVALVELCARVLEAGFRLIDVQEETEHLASLGQVLVRRADYLDVLAVLRDRPAPLAVDRRPVARLAG